MSVVWTASQQQALEAREKRLLVSAGAGSGKTAVLTARITGMIISGEIDPARLLVCTFTRAAAWEMRARLVKQLQEAMQKPEHAANEALRQRVAGMARAQIGTLHSVCQAIVRQYFVQAQFEPGARMLETHAAERLLAQSLQEAAETLYADQDADFLAFTQAFVPRIDDKRCMDEVLSLYRRLRSSPDWQQALEQAAREYLQAESADSPYSLELARHVTDELRYALRLLEQAVAALEGQDEKVAEWFCDRAQQVEALLQAAGEGLEAFLRATDVMKKPNTLRMKNKVDEDLAEWLTERKKLTDDIIKKCTAALRACSSTATGSENACAEMAGPVWGLVALILATDERYTARKAAVGGVDFGDLEHGCLRALRDPGVLAACRETYGHVYVDEYQDINPLQEVILSLLAEGGEMFMVGDVKQAIYRFRHGDVGLFLQKLRDYEGVGAPGRTIVLRENFRSASEVLDCVNDLFEPLWQGGALQLRYDDSQRMVPGQELPAAPPVQVHVIEEPTKPSKQADEGEEQPEDEGLSGVAATAHRVGEIIQGYLAQDFALRDICILMRVVRGQTQKAQVLARHLGSLGIAARADVAAGGQSPAAQMVESYLRLIDNADRDWALAAVLLSPAVGMSLDALVALRAKHPQKSLCRAMETAAEEQPRLARLFVHLQRSRELATVLPLGDWLWWALRDSGLWLGLCADDATGASQSALQGLLQRASDYDKNGRAGLQGFLEDLEQGAAAGDGDDASGRADDEDAVTLLSVHKSKGLEFPCVIVVGMGEDFARLPSHPEFLFDPEMGLALPYANPERRLHTPTRATQAVMWRDARLARAEQMRLMYVAVTRAKSRLALVGTLPASAFAQLDAPRELAAGRARRWMEWVLLALRDHPDGHPLRERIHWQGQVRREAKGRFEINIGPVEAQEIQAEQARSLRRTLAAAAEADLPVQRTFAPPTLPGQLRPGKRTVTQWAADLAPQEVANASIFDGPAPRDAAMRGVSLHALLERLDFTTPLTADQLAEQAKTALDRGWLPALPDAAALAAVAWFMQTPLGRQLGQHPIDRERRFTYAIDGVLVQGVIDALIETPEGFILVDYKLSARSSASLAEHYAPQLRLYAQAVKALTGRQVVRMVLVHLSARECIEVEMGESGFAGEEKFSVPAILP